MRIDSPSAAHGAVFIELTLTLVVLFLLLAGATDYSRWQRENLVLHQASKHGVQTASNVFSSGNIPESVNAGVLAAFDYVGSMGMNPFQFDYEIWSRRNDNSFFMKIRANVNTQRFVLLPKSLYYSCGSAQMSAPDIDERLAAVIISPNRTPSLANASGRTLSCKEPVGGAPEFSVWN